MSTEEAGKKALNDLKPFQCPMCKYKAATASLLSRHINFHHPEMRDRVPGHLLNVLNGKKNVPDMLVSVAKWIENATTFDERLPEDVISYLKREDAKTQLILRVIAIGKIQRAMELGDKIKELDTELDEKLKDPQFKKDASPSIYLSLLERLQTLQEKELHFLKEVTQLGEVNLNGVVDKLVEAFGTAQLGSAKNTVGLKVAEVTLPVNPADREELRSILRQLGIGNKINESNNPDITTEAIITESAGADSKKD